MNLLDFLFGAQPLQKATQTGTPTPPVNNQDAGIDVGKLAQQSANQQLAPALPPKKKKMGVTPPSSGPMQKQMLNYQPPGGTAQ